MLSVSFNCRFIKTNEIEQDVEGSERGPLRVLPVHLPRGTAGNHGKSVTITDIRADILTQNCQSTKQDCYEAHRQPQISLLRQDCLELTRLS